MSSTKPGQLSEDEWELMRQHPLEGAKLTAPLAGWLGQWANTIAEHHERFDGRGYPHGLGGHEISTGGRIVAVADSYDTMTSVRSYNKPMSTDAARAELAACAGAQFDPVIVRAFLAVSVSRLRAVAPLAWLGSLPFGNLGPQLARAVAAGGRGGGDRVGGRGGRRGAGRCPPRWGCSPDVASRGGRPRRLAGVARNAGIRAPGYAREPVSRRRERRVFVVHRQHARCTRRRLRRRGGVECDGDGEHR